MVGGGAENDALIPAKLVARFGTGIPPRFIAVTPSVGSAEYETWSTLAKFTLPLTSGRKPSGVTKSGAIRPSSANDCLAINTRRPAVLGLGSPKGKSKVLTPPGPLLVSARPAHWFSPLTPAISRITMNCTLPSAFEYNWSKRKR